VFARAIRTDPALRDLLYAGTETGVYVSFDDGGSWAPLKGNLPVVPIHDLVVKEPEGDLVLATHGRSFWVLDDLGPVRALTPDMGQQAAVLVKPRPTVRYLSNTGFSHKPVKGKNYRMPGAVMVTYRQSEDPRTGDQVDEFLDAGKNPPNGAIISYFLTEGLEGEISMTFLHADGQEIRSFSSKVPEESGPSAAKSKEPRIPKEPALNRWVWNLRYPDATKLENDETGNDMVEAGIGGPLVPPGTYRVRLVVGEQTFEQDFEVRKDPRVPATDADLQAQFELLRQLRQRLSDSHQAINELRAIRRRAEDWAARAKDKPELESVAEAAQAVVERLKPIEAELIQVEARSRGDSLNYPVRLNGKLAALVGVVASADAAPTASAKQVFGELSSRVQAQLDQLAEAVVTEVGNLNERIRTANIPPVGA
jgi:hypothetical protein